MQIQKVCQQACKQTVGEKKENAKNGATEDMDRMKSKELCTLYIIHRTCQCCKNETTWADEPLKEDTGFFTKP